MESIQIYTIGFTQKTAQAFFSKLRDAGVRRIVDVRLNNTSQLAGFSKRDDLVFFLREIAGIEYVHLPELAPTKDILDAYKKHKGSWAVYEEKFFELMGKGESRNRSPRTSSIKGAFCAANTGRTTVTDGWWPSILSDIGAMSRPNI